MIGIQNRDCVVGGEVCGGSWGFVRLVLTMIVGCEVGVDDDSVAVVASSRCHRSLVAVVAGLQLPFSPVFFLENGT
ncbi:hypothetical protein QYF36_012445 [Acer negundo]|nr:hypothetical protein QYF36_012445 [Acer negundo]